jgi:hypothetical protein
MNAKHDALARKHLIERWLYGLCAGAILCWAVISWACLQKIAPDPEALSGPLFPLSLILAGSTAALLMMVAGILLLAIALLFATFWPRRKDGAS